MKKRSDPLPADRDGHPNTGPEPLLSWGVDGCPAGWFYFALGAKGEYCYGVVEDLRETTERADRRDRILVDVPIGLRDGPRSCDVLARRVLGNRHASVFPSPARAALDATDYDDACRRNEEAAGKQLTKQVFGILPKIRAVDDLLRRDAKARKIVREMHPELCFWALNNRAPMRHNKRARAGFEERMAVLESCWAGARAAVREVSGRYRRKDVARDDIPDAMVAALTGRAAKLKLLPEQPALDARLPMQIAWADRDAIQIG